MKCICKHLSGKIWKNTRQTVQKVAKPSVDDDPQFTVFTGNSVRNTKKVVTKSS